MLNSYFHSLGKNLALVCLQCSRLLGDIATLPFAWEHLWGILSEQCPGRQLHRLSRRFARMWPKEQLGVFYRGPFVAGPLSPFVLVIWANYGKMAAPVGRPSLS